MLLRAHGGAAAAVAPTLVHLHDDLAKRIGSLQNQKERKRERETVTERTREREYGSNMRERENRENQIVRKPRESEKAKTERIT